MAKLGPYHGAANMRGLEIMQKFREKDRIGGRLEWFEGTKTSVPPELYPAGSRFWWMFPPDSDGKNEANQARAQQQPQDKGDGAVEEDRPSEELKKFGTVMGGASESDDNIRIHSGFTFLGQFLGHDITFDPTSSIEQQRDVNALRNYRTPALDLDSLYGSGLIVSPHLYDRDQKGKFLLDKDREFDLPRNTQGTALIADPRNDGNLILAQLHLAFLKFHNAVYDQVDRIDDGYVRNEQGNGYVKKDDKENGRRMVEDRFEKTQRLVRWHYQWMILREFLPLIVGKNVVLDILQYLMENDGKLEYYQWTGPDPFIPVEFSVAAYRFGHSQVRSIYRINDNYDVGVLPFFSPKLPGAERHDLQGGRIEKKHEVNWKNFFDTGGQVTPGGKRHSKLINTQLTGPLLSPPHTVVPNRPGETRSLAMENLAVRDLHRGLQRELLSGQEVARSMMKKKRVKITSLDEKQLNFDELFRKNFSEKEQQQLADLKRGFVEQTPLWYYILKEAEVQRKGKMLGDVGGRIVAEVFIGLLQADDTSLMGVVDLAHLCTKLHDDNNLQDETDPSLGKAPKLKRQGCDWKPILSLKQNGKFIGNDRNDFTMVDLLRFAGVDTE